MYIKGKNSQNHINDIVSKFVLENPNLAKRSDLGKWASALEAYGTPGEFALGTQYMLGEFTIHQKQYPCVTTESKNFDMRRELMSTQSPYFNLTPQDKINFGENCFLCENIMQAIDAPKIEKYKKYLRCNPNEDEIRSTLVELESICKLFDNYFGDNKVHEMPFGFLFLPNRYPGCPGHSLLLPISHDDMTLRNSFVVEKDEFGKNKPRRYIPENGKTNGNIMSPEFVYVGIKACEDFGYLIIRNNVLDGMSIPNHDHFQAFPLETPWVMLTKSIREKKEIDSSLPKGYYKLENTPFDTLAVEGKTPEELSDKVANLLGKMEKDNQVFTLMYDEGTFLISPRRETDSYIQVGAGVPSHNFDAQPDFLEKVKKWVPLKGEYNWNKYI